MDKEQKELFVSLVEAYKDNLFRVAYSIVGTRQGAEDCLSEAILKGYQAFSKLRELDYFNTWIMRILINVCKDELRKKKHLVELENVEEVQASDLQNNLLVESVMGMLPLELREIVALKLFSGYTFKEIGILVKMSEGKVKKKYYKALEILEARKEEFYG